MLETNQRLSEEVIAIYAAYRERIAEAGRKEEKNTLQQDDLGQTEENERTQMLLQEATEVFGDVISLATPMTNSKEIPLRIAGGLVLKLRKGSRGNWGVLMPSVRFDTDTSFIASTEFSQWEHLKSLRLHEGDEKEALFIVIGTLMEDWKEASKKAEENKQKQERVQQVSQEIEDKIEKALSKYPSWVEGKTLKLYKWSWCTGSDDEGSNYEIEYSFQSQLKEVGKDCYRLETVDNKAIILHPFNFPYAEEITLDSLESCKSAYLSQKPTIKLKGLDITSYQPTIYKYDPEGLAYHQPEFYPARWVCDLIGLTVPTEIVVTEG